MRFTHPFTYWPPGSDTPEHHYGYLALAAVAPRGAASKGSSRVALRQDVLAAGGVVAAGHHDSSVPLQAREVMTVTTGTSRRAARTLYEGALSDFDGTALHDQCKVWRTVARDDGMGGILQEPVLVGTFPCNATVTPAEEVVAENERPAGTYTITALRDTDLREGDTLYLQERAVYLGITGHVDRNPVGLFLLAQAGVSDEQSPDDLQP